ncbi:MAG TPA: SGNH/GDSL hydrolase family protein [Sphingomicrobium sp.]|jgi:lysophospholipase L1-like esterase
MSHVVLLGDSIFDNRVYVSPEPDVRHQLQAHVGAGWKVTLLAVDGHVTADVRRRQLQQVPKSATHLVISVGGNDALGHASLLGERANTVAEAVGRLAQAQSSFAAAYSEMIDAVQQLGLPTSVCTIYDANYPEPQRRLVVTALALFNDVITRAAFSRGLPLVDLRLICIAPSDYANPIEPSSQGGDKIAAAIAAMVVGSATGRAMSSVWV